MAGTLTDLTGSPAPSVSGAGGGVSLRQWLGQFTSGSPTASPSRAASAGALVSSGGNTSVLASLPPLPAPSAPSRAATPLRDYLAQLNTQQNLGFAKTGAGFADSFSRFFGAPSSLTNITSGLTTAGGLAAGALDLSQGKTATGALKLAGAAPGVVSAAGRFGAALPTSLSRLTPLLGAAAGAAGIGLDLASGKPNVPSDVMAAMPVAQTGASLLGATGLASALGAIGWIPAAGMAFAEGINAIFNSPKQGEISKAKMKATQNALLTGAGQAKASSLVNAPDFPAALAELAKTPGGTGQLQYGVGQEYTGETTVGGPGLTSTPGWSSTVAQAQRDPVSFIRNLWVQGGEGGATTYAPAATQNYRMILLGKLPYTAETNALRQQILANPTPPDPRSGTTLRDPKLPVEANAINLENGVRLPTDHRYAAYNTGTTPPSMHPIPVERVAEILQASPTREGLDRSSGLYDVTTGRPLSVAHVTDAQVIYDDQGTPINKKPRTEYRFDPSYLRPTSLTESTT